MYLSSSDGIDGVDVDDSSQTRQENTSPATPNSSQSSFTSCPTLLVIDDNSNSDDSSLKTNDMLLNSMLSTAQTTHVQVTPSSPLSNIDTSNDTPDQQRRRNSSIAKLLGGQPLINQQYKEINQQILDDQSTQSVTSNSDNKTDSGLKRSRSSLTRTLLMNAERSNNASTEKARPTSPVFSKDFEYLIRRELDIDHAPSTLHRDDSTPSVFQNLTSARNTPSADAQSSSQSRQKRKKPNPKQTIPTPTVNKSSNVAPFVIRDPFELDSSAPSLPPLINPTVVHRSQQQQNDLYHFDIAHHRHRHPQIPQPQQQYSLPMNNSTPNATSFNRQKLNRNLPVYTQFKIHPDRLQSAPCNSTSSSSSPYNYCHYPTELALPTPVSPLSLYTSSQSSIPYHTTATSSRKTKAMNIRPDIYEVPMQRSCSILSSQSSGSSSSSTSSGHSVPLKKRLLHAYNNEQRPSSTL